MNTILFWTIFTLINVMFDTRTRLSFFACQKDAAGAALKNAALAPGSAQQKNRLRLRNTANCVVKQHLL